MLELRPAAVRRILCLGSHADDIEIGCGGTLLKLLADHPGAEVDWVVFSAQGERAAEARRSAQAFLSGAASAHGRAPRRPGSPSSPPSRASC